MEDEALLSLIRSDFKEARKHSGGWRSAATESYKFVAGGRGQWNEEDVNALEEQERPVITFNRIGPYIDAVSGNEINGRHTIKYLPRTLGDSKINETYTAAIRWVRDNCNAEDEESDAFTDVLIGGMGWIETSMGYDEDPDGEILIDRVDPMQMYWDPTAKKRNLEDRRWQSRSEWFSEEEIKEMWPGKEIAPGSSTWADDPEESGGIHNASLAFLYKKDATGYDEKEKKYRVIHYQWFEHKKVVRVKDPESNKLVEFSDERWSDMEKKLPNAKSVKQKKKVFMQAFVCGDTVLEKSEIKCAGFTFKCITGKRNKVENTWYGLVENMKDPQRWANKFFSQILHIVNSNAKGGLMAEVGAFVDAKKAEDQWADPTAVMLLKNGGLNKIKERSAATFPQALDRLMQFAVGSIPSVAGINLETIGLQQHDQAGILEQERKKATFTVLAPFFDSLRRYRKEEGRLLFHFVNEYISDGRLIRVTTDQGEQWVPLNRSDEDLEYDIIIDESPTSPNQKMEVWATMEKLLPALMKDGVGLPEDFFKYSPLPTELADKMTKAMKQRVPPQLQQKMQEMGQTIQKLGQENQAMKQDMSLEGAKLQSKDAQAQQKAQMAMQKLQAEYQQNMQDLQIKNQQHIDKLTAKMAEQQRQHEHELTIAQSTSASEAAERAFKVWETQFEGRMQLLVASISKAQAVTGEEVSAAKSAVENKPPDIHIHMPSGNKKIIKHPDGSFESRDVTVQ